MNCPHCNKKINAFTGLQEIQKFQKHLSKCKKAPHNEKVTFEEALEQRAKSGQ